MSDIELSDTLSQKKLDQLVAASKAGLFDQHAAFSIVDYDTLRETVESLQKAFPDHFLHTFATKANYFLPILKRLKQLGMGMEVAGSGELELAALTNIDPKKIVFDAPAKTTDELTRALEMGIAINIDNFQEFNRIKNMKDKIISDTCIGFRINPQIGSGKVAYSSTATMTSKFGVGLKDGDNREVMIKAYLGNSWLNSIHVHVGSVGCPLSLMAKGVSKTVELAEEINQRAGRQRILTIDIGGGLPVNFSSDSNDPQFSDYADELVDQAPALFSGQYRVFTEFGRSVVSKSAYTLARVEYTKTMGGRHIALTHAGAHNMMRIVFQPDVFARRITALSRDGTPKVGEPVIQDIAGPCCFASDIIAHQRPLPLLEPGDFVMVHDTGAYCFSNHFNYNALPSDPVYSSQIDKDNVINLDQIHQGQSTEDLVQVFF